MRPVHSVKVFLNANISKKGIQKKSPKISLETLFNKSFWKEIKFLIF